MLLFRSALTLRPRSSYSGVLFLLLIGPIAASGCAPGLSEGEGPGHRTQALALTPEQELSLGTKAYHEVLSKSHVVNGPQAQRISQIGSRIAKAAEIKPLQREINLRMQGYSWNWEYKLLENPQVNAFACRAARWRYYRSIARSRKRDDQLYGALPRDRSALAHQPASASLANRCTIGP